MRLTKIGNQSVLASIIHLPALDDDQIAAVGDIDVSQDCEQRLKLREDVLLMEAVVLPRSWSLRTLITDDHEALCRCAGSRKARSPLIIPEDQAGCGWSYAAA
jgi:hypothetical protein